MYRIFFVATLGLTLALSPVLIFDGAADAKGGEGASSGGSSSGNGKGKSDQSGSSNSGSSNKGAGVKGTAGPSGDGPSAAKGSADKASSNAGANGSTSVGGKGKSGQSGPSNSGSSNKGAGAKGAAGASAGGQSAGRGSGSNTASSNAGASGSTSGGGKGKSGQSGSSNKRCKGYRRSKRRGPERFFSECRQRQGRCRSKPKQRSAIPYSGWCQYAERRRGHDKSRRSGNSERGGAGLRGPRITGWRGDRVRLPGRLRPERGTGRVIGRQAIQLAMTSTFGMFVPPPRSPVAACREAVISAALPLGAERVTVSGAGPVRRRGEALSAPLERLGQVSA